LAGVFSDDEIIKIILYLGIKNFYSAFFSKNSFFMTQNRYNFISNKLVIYYLNVQTGFSALFGNWSMVLGARTQKWRS